MQLEVLLYDNRRCSLLLATYLRAASCAISRDFHRCTNWPDSGDLPRKERIFILAISPKKIYRVGSKNNSMDWVPTPRFERIQAPLSPGEKLPAREAIICHQPVIHTSRKSVATL